jgi:enoyl-CoA hydratase/carnithine racemase
VVPDGELLERAKDLGRRLAERAPLALAAIKQLVAEAPYRTPDEAYAAERREFLRLAQTEDAVEGIKAFFFGGRPQFRGR